METPAGEGFLRRVEAGGVLTCEGVTASAWPLLAALVQARFPRRPVVLVVADLKLQEALQ